MRIALLCLASLALGACADQTGVMVRVSSTDLAVPTDLDGLTIRAHTPDALMTDHTYALTSGWPQSLLVRPASGQMLGDLTVEVTGSLGGAAIVRRVLATSFIPGQVRVLEVVLSRSCAHVACADGVDCVDGTCRGATLDAGLVDAASVDGGNDAGVDVGVDAGMDAGVDAGIDAGLDTGPTNDAGVDAGPCIGHACVVISEVAPHGVDAFDEFVELYNHGSSAVDVGGCALVYYTNAGAAMPRATFATGTTIASHHFYLLGSMGYMGTVAPDMPNAWSSGLADSDATISFECGGAPVDRLGYGVGATVREGNPAPAIPTAELSTASYERKAVMSSTPATLAPGGADAMLGNGYDTNDNASDFVILATRDPASSTSPSEP
jgi:hypothetical protein